MALIAVGNNRKAAGRMPPPPTITVHYLLTCAVTEAPWMTPLFLRGPLPPPLLVVPPLTVVETTCTWDAAAREFELHTPNDGAQKNWISQGCTADWAVVVADLLVSGKSHGPHAFLMRPPRVRRAPGPSQHCIKSPRITSFRASCLKTSILCGGGPTGMK